MIAPLFPCLWFDGKAAEAAKLYCSIFKNSQIISESELVAIFSLNGQKVMGLNGGPMFQINPSISLFVTCDSAAEANRIWEQLIDRGSSYIPINSYPWSERYGWLKDRYGMTWQISSSGKNNQELRIIPSMLFVGDKFGKAGEAIKHYSGIFENSSTEVMEYYPDGDWAGKVLYSEFTINFQRIIAMDGPGVHEYDFNEGVSFSVECDTQEEIDYLWEKLTEGGEESMCGWLKDRFGVSWQIVPSVLKTLMADPVKGPKVMEAFLKMRKFEIDKLLST